MALHPAVVCSSYQHCYFFLFFCPFPFPFLFPLIVCRARWLQCLYPPFRKKNKNFLPCLSALFFFCFFHFFLLCLFFLVLGCPCGLVILPPHKLFKQVRTPSLYLSPTALFHFFAFSLLDIFTSSPFRFFTSSLIRIVFPFLSVLSFSNKFRKHAITDSGYPPPRRRGSST